MDSLLAEQRSRHTRARLTGVKEHSPRDGTVFWDVTKPIQYKFDGNHRERISLVDSDPDSDICLFDNFTEELTSINVVINLDTWRTRR